MRIAVVGGGPVGQVVARRFQKHDVTMFEPSLEKPRMSLALAESTLSLFDQLELRVDAGESMQSIHVSEQGIPGSMQLVAADLGFAQFGRVVCSQDLEGVLQTQSAVQTDRRVVVSVLARSHTGGPRIALDDGSTEQVDLVCLCDGGRSPLVNALGLSPQYRDFGRSAVLMRVDVTHPIPGEAIERFTSTGPLALLPLGGTRYGVVWSLAPANAQALAADTPRLLQSIERALDGRLGHCSGVTDPVVIPLVERWLDSPYRPGIVIFGNGAQTIHPVAGQGLNLALRGVSRVADAIEAGTSLDRLDQRIRDGFSSWRQDRAQTRLGSSLLEQIFAIRHPMRRFVSGALVSGLDHSLDAKRWIAHAGMGRYA